jgi:hypothetical protein
MHRQLFQFAKEVLCVYLYVPTSVKYLFGSAELDVDSFLWSSANLANSKFKCFEKFKFH